MTNKNRPAFVLLSAVCLLAGSSVPPAALAQNGISGYSGNMDVIDIARFEYWTSNVSGAPRSTVDGALSGISWMERDNRPCKLVAMGEFIHSNLRLRPTIHFDADKYVRDLCGGTSQNPKTVKFSNPTHFVQGLAVCTNDRKDSANARLKGIRIYGAEVKPDGTVTALNAEPEHNQHTNCDGQWHPAVMCPADQVVTGLKVFHKTAATNKKAFAGLGILCTKPAGRG